MAWHCRRAEPDELASGDLDQIRVIYEASFSPSLKEPFPALIEPVMHGQAALYLASAHHRVGGFAVAVPLGIAGVNYLAYLAVAPKQRGKSIGSSLFRCVVNEAYRRTGARELLWEVERPDVAAGTDDINRRRIVFYERQGAVLLDCVSDFRMPDLAGPGSVPGMLMWTSVVDRPPLQAVEIEAYVIALYSDIYGRDQDDALVRHVLRSIRVGT
jgi:GNAT superfamily N-acetyltransferase